jgi:hypothetical protein
VSRQSSSYSTSDRDGFHNCGHSGLSLEGYNLPQIRGAGSYEGFITLSGPGVFRDESKIVAIAVNALFTNPSDTDASAGVREVNSLSY